MRFPRSTVGATILCGAAPLATVAGADDAVQLRAAAQALRAERCAEAEASFSGILDVDPDRVEALYGRGLSRACVGNFPAAVTDLSRVAERRPDDLRVAFDLGSALANQGRYEEAGVWLRKAAAASELEGPALLLLGYCQLNLGDLEAARASLSEASRVAPQLEEEARQYGAVVAYHSGDPDAALADFDRVRRARAESPLGEQAESFADAIRAESDAAFRVGGSAGFEYDSNVALAPDEHLYRDPGQESLDDGRFTLGAHVRWLGVDSNALRVEAGYAFYQSLHFDLDDYDLQSHRPDIDLSYRLGPVTLGLNALYEIYLRGRAPDSFEHQWALRPSAVLDEGEFGETGLAYRVRQRDFADDDFDDLDGFNHAIALDQGVWLGDRSRRLSFGYAFDAEILDDMSRIPPYDPEDPPPPPVHEKNDFAYDGHEVHVGATTALPAEFSGAVTYAFRHEDYDSGSTFTTDDGGRERRNDDRHTVSFTLSRPLVAHLWISGGYFGSFNDSNNAAYTYERHVAFVTVSAEF